MPMKTESSTQQPEKPAKDKGIREILLAGVFWRILVIEMILLAWSVVYKMASEGASGADLLWYALRIILLVVVIILFMMVSLRRFLEKKIIRPMEAVAEGNRRLDVTHPEVDNVTLDDDVAVEIREIVSTRARMLDAILNVSNQRLQLVNFIKDTFGRYLSRKIVDEILESPEGRRIGGRRQTVTVLMSDLRGFSDLSDTRDPEEMVRVYRGARADRGEDTSPAEIFMAIQTDRIFRVPAIRLAETLKGLGQPAYNYLFTWKSPFFKGRLGSCHALELGFLFGTFEEKFSGSGEKAERLARDLQNAWIAFAHGGDPSSNCPASSATLEKWPVYGDLRETMMLGETTTLENSPYDDERKAWDQISDTYIGSL